MDCNVRAMLLSELFQNVEDMVISQKNFLIEYDFDRTVTRKRSYVVVMTDLTK